MVIFVVITALLLKLMPGPRKDSDYLVIRVHRDTSLKLAAVFVLVVTTTTKPGKFSDVFFKKTSQGFLSRRTKTTGPATSARCAR